MTEPTTTSTRIAVRTITITMSESARLRDGATYTTFRAVNAALRDAARQGPDAEKDGTYDKTFFRVEFVDGEVYEGRVDLQAHLALTPDLLGDHMRTHLLTYAGDRRPPRMTDDQYAEHLAVVEARNPGHAADCLRILNGYAIGEAHDPRDPDPTDGVDEFPEAGARPALTETPPDFDGNTDVARVALTEGDTRTSADGALVITRQGLDKLALLVGDGAAPGPDGDTEALWIVQVEHAGVRFDADPRGINDRLCGMQVCGWVDDAEVPAFARPPYLVLADDTRRGVAACVEAMDADDRVRSYHAAVTCAPDHPDAVLITDSAVRVRRVDGHPPQVVEPRGGLPRDFLGPVADVATLAPVLTDADVAGEGAPDLPDEDAPPPRPEPEVDEGVAIAALARWLEATEGNYNFKALPSPLGRVVRPKERGAAAYEWPKVTREQLAAVLAAARRGLPIPPGCTFIPVSDLVFPAVPTVRDTVHRNEAAVAPAYAHMATLAQALDGVDDAAADAIRDAMDRLWVLMTDDDRTRTRTDVAVLTAAPLRPSEDHRQARAERAAHWYEVPGATPDDVRAAFDLNAWLEATDGHPHHVGAPLTYRTGTPPDAPRIQVTRAQLRALVSIARRRFVAAYALSKIARYLELTEGLETNMHKGVLLVTGAKGGVYVDRDDLVALVRESVAAAPLPEGVNIGDAMHILHEGIAAHLAQAIAARDPDAAEALRGMHADDAASVFRDVVAHLRGTSVPRGAT